MKSKLIADDQGRKVYALVLEKGDEAKTAITGFARRQGLGASQITAIGAFQKVTLAYFDREKKEYLEIPVDEQVEVLSLVGDVVIDKGEPSVHAHCVVGRRDGTTRGGHLLEGHVWPTLEVIVSESPEHLQKRYDPETGLTLINP
jgi:predicted DNA-binding protein with PD1-like motif